MNQMQKNTFTTIMILLLNPCVQHENKGPDENMSLIVKERLTKPTFVR